MMVFILSPTMAWLLAHHGVAAVCKCCDSDWLAVLAGPHAPVTPVSEAAPVPVNAVKQSREALAGHAAAAPVPFEQPPASGAPVTRATRSKARRAQKEGMKAQDAAQESPAAPPAVSAGAETPLPAAASPDSRPARAVSGSISQAAIGTAQPLLIRIKQDTGESGGGQQQPAMPIIPLSTSAAGDAGSGTPSKDALAASPAPGGGGAAGAQLRRSGRSARKDGKAAGSGSSSPATTPPPPPAPAAPGGVSRTVTSLSHGGRPTGPAISSPRDLQVRVRQSFQNPAWHWASIPTVYGRGQGQVRFGVGAGVMVKVRKRVEAKLENKLWKAADH